MEKESNKEFDVYQNEETLWKSFKESIEYPLRTDDILSQMIINEENPSSTFTDKFISDLRMCISHSIRNENLLLKVPSSFKIGLSSFDEGYFINYEIPNDNIIDYYINIFDELNEKCFVVVYDRKVYVYDNLSNERKIHTFSFSKDGKWYYDILHKVDKLSLRTVSTWFPSKEKMHSEGFLVVGLFHFLIPLSD
jgi:hypothetical protein